MSEIKKSPSATVPRGSDWLKEAGRRAELPIVKTGPRAAATVEVPKVPKEIGRTAQRKRLRDKIDEVVADAAAMKSAGR